MLSGFYKIPALPTIFAVALATIAPSAHAAFHLWTLKELFTNVDGTQQFIEFSTTSSGQNFVSNVTVEVTNSSGQKHDFVIPSNLPTGPSTQNQDFIIATSTITAANGVTPDFNTLPANFLLTGTGTKIALVGTTQGAVTYTVLPTDGVHAEFFPGPTTAVNLATNFAGQSAQVVPEPATWGLLGLAGFGTCIILRRTGFQRQK